MRSRVLITGGAGYVGTKLVGVLIAMGYEVVVYDTFWFGDKLPPVTVRSPDRIGDEANQLIKIKGDIRDIKLFESALRIGGKRADAVIHLACISNDPSFELDEILSKAINYHAFAPLVQACLNAGVRRFINCSTSSVYGISDSPDVREDHPHVPLTLYNTCKSQCERVLWATRGTMEAVCIRPATIAGCSKRQRLDLAVNILTNLAYNKGQITVYGGKQMRPNLHIDDMVACYVALLLADRKKVDGETFNVGAENSSISSLADMVRSIVEELKGGLVNLVTEKIEDTRSYQINSDKIASVIGFKPVRLIDSAVYDLCNAFKSGAIPNPLTCTDYYNVQHMRKIFPELYKGAPKSSFKPKSGILSELDLYRGAGRT